jgi:putative DNA primase/helicase
MSWPGRPLARPAADIRNIEGRNAAAGCGRMNVVPLAQELPSEARPPAFSDEALALRFAERHEYELRYVAVWSRWMFFDGLRWAADDTRFAFTLARVVCREAAAGCNKPRIAAQIASAKTRAAAIMLANDDRRLAATTAQWDAVLDTFNTPRGTR